MLIAAQGYANIPVSRRDGTKIAFESNRSEYPGIWVCKRDGSVRQITSMPGLAGTRPVGRHDSRSLASNFRPKNTSEIYVVEVPGGAPRDHDGAGANNVVPSWSLKWPVGLFVFQGGRERFQVWKVPIRGGRGLQTTKKAGCRARSGTTAFSYFTKKL